MKLSYHRFLMAAFLIGITAAHAIAADPAAGAAPAEEKTEFTVVLKEVPADKMIAVIKEVRAITGLGLKEAKDIVEAAPKEVAKDVSKDDAAKFKKQLEDAGAKVDCHRVDPLGAQRHEDAETVATRLDWGGHYYKYLELEGWIEDTLKQFDAPVRASGQPIATAMLTGARMGAKALGLYEFDDFGASSVDLGDGRVRNRTILRVKSKTGLFELLGKGGELEATKRIDPSAGVAFATRFDIGAIPGLVRRVVRSAAGSAGTVFLNMMREESRKDLGLDIEDWIAAMGDEFGGYIRIIEGEVETVTIGGQETEIPKTGLAFFMHLRDPAVGTSITTLLANVGIGEKTQIDGKSAVEITVPDPVRYRFVIGTDNDWVCLASSADEFRHWAARGTTDRGLLANAEFAEATRDLPSPASGVFFASPKLATIAVSIINAAGGDIRNHPDVRDIALGLERLDQPTVGIRLDQPDGFLWISQGDPDWLSDWSFFEVYPGRTLIVGGVVAAVAAPAFLRARENSRGRACQENLSKIDGAKQQWALDNNKSADAVPTWDDLVGETKYLRRMPVCPSKGTYTLGPVDESPTCSIGATKRPFEAHTMPE